MKSVLQLFIFDLMKNVPNILSTLRLLLAPVFLALYIQDEVVWRALSIAVFVMAVFTDYIDGYIARLYKAQSPAGVFLDPLADKFLTFAGFICLPFIDPQQFPWWAVGAIIVRDIVVTCMRLVADYRGISMRTRYIAKVKTLSQMLFLYLVLMTGVFISTNVWLSVYAKQLMETGLLGWGMLAVVVLTVYSGLEYIYLNKKIFLISENAKAKTDYR